MNLERYNSYDLQNGANEIRTFNPSVQSFESIQNHRLQTENSDSIRCDIPVIVTRIENHYYYHQYVYIPITQKEVHYYHHGQQQCRNLCERNQFIDK